LGCLNFAQKLAQVLGEAGQPGTRAEQFQASALFGQERAQNHQPAFLIQQHGPRSLQLLQDEAGQTFK
jgi:hypothetical protein